MGPSEDEKGRGLRCALLLAGLTLLAFWPALGAGFVWDDRTVTSNPLLTAPGGLAKIWFEPSAQPFEPHYWPLTYTTFWLEVRAFGDSPAGYHATSLALHVLNVLLVWRLARRLGVPGAWWGAALFALHPVHVEAVAWVTERKGLLSCAFALAAVLAWLRFHRGRRPLDYAVALLLFVAAMWSKTSALGLPLGLALVSWWKGPSFRLRSLVPLVPFGAVALGLALFDLHLAGGKDPVDLGFSLLDRVSVVGRSFWFYVAKLAWPFPLYVMYDRFDPEAARLFSLACAGALVALFWWLYAARARIGLGPLVAIGFFAVALAPTLGFVDYSLMRFSFAADRYQYLASLGPLLLVGVALGRLTAGSGGRAVASIVIVALGVVTFLQTRHWRDDNALWSHTLRHHPESAMAWLNFGTALERDGQVNEALDAYHRSLEIDPDQARVHYNVGLALFASGRALEARRSLEEGLRLAPDFVPLIVGLGRVVGGWEGDEASLPYYERAIALDPGSADALFLQGLALLRLARLDEALTSLDECIAVAPNDAEAHAIRGKCLSELGRIPEAIRAFERALSLDPDSRGVAEELEGLRTGP